LILATASRPLAQTDTDTPRLPLEEVQHRLVLKDQVFRFSPANLHKRGAEGYVTQEPGSSAPAVFAMPLAADRNETFFFRLRHPVRIMPFTEYALDFRYAADSMSGKGAFLELALYDDSREKSIASHRFEFIRPTDGWVSGRLHLRTGGDARFLRLLLKGHPGASGLVRLAEVSLRQTSDAGTDAPKPEPLVTMGAKPLTTRGEWQSESIPIPAEGSVFDLRLDMHWHRFRGGFDIRIDWGGTETPTAGPVSDRVSFRHVEGVQSRWDGLAWERRRQQGTWQDKVSLGRGLLQNANDSTGEGVALIRLQRPAGASRVLLRWEAADLREGRLALRELQLFRAY
jgi:hypothetical protein